MSMRTLPLRRPAGRASLGRVLGYAFAAIALSFVGSAIARTPDSALVPIVGLVALVLGLNLAAYGIHSRTWTSPLTLIGVPLLLSLAASTTPVTRIFSNWSIEALLVVTLIVIAPLVGVTIAMLATDGRVPRLAAGTQAEILSGRLIAVCSVLYVVGAVVLATQFKNVGGPPLLSENIEAARFSPVGTGLLQLATDGLPLAMLIAAWARLARPASFSALQRRLLEFIIGSVPIMMALGGGRITVLLPVLSACVVSARYIKPNSARRLMFVLPVVLMAFSSAVFLARHEQDPSRTNSQAILFNSSDQSRRSLLESSYAGLAITFGEQLRVLGELQNAHVSASPFTTSVYFTHRFNARAVNAGTIASVYAGNWQASGYAGPLLLDFGLLTAVFFGVILGALAHLGYRRFADGMSITAIWVYAYLAGLLAVAFYDNLLLNYAYPFIDVAVLMCLSRIVLARTTA